MKTVVYITKNKIWARESAYDWDGVSLDEVFGRIKKELKADDIRVVMGNDVSFITAVKAGDTFLSRENVLKMVKSWMPFEIDNSCFDWKQVVLGSNEIWIQIVALEKELMMSLSSAVKKHGIRVELVTAIGILLGEKTVKREAPVIIKWTDKENLSILAINGLVDLVAADISEDDLMVYATQKWNLAVNPEEISMSASDFNLSENVFSEKTKGEDRLILNLPILKNVVTEVKSTLEKTESGEGEEVLEVREEEKKPTSKLWIYLLALIIVLGVGVFVLYKAGMFQSVFPQSVSKTEMLSPTPTITETVTPSPTVVDLSPYRVQVLNGSGVTGEAANIKTTLISNGFVYVDTGNTTATTEAVIKAKTSIPLSVVDKVSESITDYMIGLPSALTSSDKYDLIIIVGSAKKL